MISYLLPTRNRPDRLAETLRRLGALSIDAHRVLGGAEVIVVDDASEPPVATPPRLHNGMPVRLVRRRRREGAAARNAGALEASGDWIVMLDDDSYPLDVAVAGVLGDVPGSVAAIGARITLADGAHEHGGLPEVIVGCGAAVRREAFLRVGGYDPAFHYYAEEYDLCARFLLAGWRVSHDWRFRVRHEKVAEGRDMDRILGRLVRNNGWIVERYAPEADRDDALTAVIDRYAEIARRENAEEGYRQGLDELMYTLDGQRKRSMDQEQWDRFTGLARARAELSDEPLLETKRVAIVDRGKNGHLVQSVLAERGDVTIVDEPDAELAVIGTLSPGPLMDAWLTRRRRGQTVLRPWTPEHATDRVLVGA